MNPQEVQTLLDYHYWARDRMLDAIELLTADQFTRDLGSSFPSVRDTVVHMFGAERNWYLRWQGASPTQLPADTFQDPNAIRGTWREHEQKMRAFVGGLDAQGLERVVPYRRPNGEHTASMMWHILQHVVNHASYHRGQVTTLLRQLGAAPPKSTDLITYYREAGARPA